MISIHLNTITHDELMRTGAGICTRCMAVQHVNVAPQAQDEPCDACGGMSVQGLKRLAIRFDLLSYEVPFATIRQPGSVSIHPLRF